MAKLSDIFDLQMGKTPARANSDYWNSGTNSWVSIADLSSYEKYVGETKEKITDIAVRESGIKAVPPNTVIMSFKLSLGKTAIAKNAVYTNEAIMAFIPNGRYNISPEYFFYMLSERDWSKGTNRAVMGATLNKATLGEINVTVPPIGEQRYVASVLDKLTGLISLRKQQLAKLDELVKARFVEMFGDPKVNPKGWKVIPLSEVINGTASNGFFAKRDEYCEDGNVQILGVVNIVNRMYSNIINLPKTNGTTVDIKKYQVKYGDMLFCRSSLVKEGIGKASIVPRDIPENILFECHVIRLPLNTSKCIPEFIQVLSTTPFFRNQIISQSKTATMTTISQDGILKSMIILPPIRLQQDFLNIVQKVDMSKLTIQQSLDKLEVLRKSLMQEYFG